MRGTVSIIIGAIVGSIVFFIMAFIANLISPTPPELMDPSTPEAVAERVASTSTYTWFTTIIGLSIGSFLGGLLGARITHSSIFKVTLGIGIILSLWAFYTFYVVYPEALWVPAAMLISIFIFTYLGGLAYAKKNKGKA
ncbi:hypothetical protein [Maribacter sp. HTCC2170]|uniref:hypothetical protein n=1 Tax=Maribacter sp. (strain HTCC2170 / KCCM 42371) TaxID=313603 RepID=UPI00006B2249|nr:hypothetical protein [Maribacter sp. HTCC2170]EAR00349.1 hypothetical protein FB2170_13046 [Maribacter sp. HTCC2170]